MYIMSKRSREQMIHDETCRYAKMTAPHNRVFFHTAEAAYAKGQIAGRYCAAAMKALRIELGELQDFCEANGISIYFEHSYGTLQIIAPESEWKIAVVGVHQLLRLYHKNTADFDNGSSPYVGFHFQNVRRATILGYLKYIVEHDRYWKEKEEKKRVLLRNMQLYFNPCADMIRGKRHIEKIRRSKHRYTSRERARYAAGM